VTRGGDFEVLKTGLTATGEPAKRYATLAHYLGTLSKLHIDAGHPDPTKDPEVLAVWRVLRRGLDRPAQKAALGFEAIRQAQCSAARRPRQARSELSPTQRKIELSILCVARPEAILTVERLAGGIFGIDNYCVHAERVPHK
jgi:hypothetical protein